MPTLTLTKTFVNLVSTGAAVSGQTSRGRGETYQLPGEVRTYAGGRRRAITGVGEAGTYTFTLLLVSRTSADTLRGWKGQLVQVRDHRGRKFYGVYFETPTAEYVDRSLWNVSITLSIVTYDEGV